VGVALSRKAISNRGPQVIGFVEQSARNLEND
jgi:hypothetical protein